MGLNTGGLTQGRAYPWPHRSISAKVGLYTEEYGVSHFFTSSFPLATPYNIIIPLGCSPHKQNDKIFILPLLQLHSIGMACLTRNINKQCQTTPHLQQQYIVIHSPIMRVPRTTGQINQWYTKDLNTTIMRKSASSADQLLIKQLRLTIIDEIDTRWQSLIWWSKHRALQMCMHTHTHTTDYKFCPG